MGKQGSRVKKWRIGRRKEGSESNPEERWGGSGGSILLRNWVLLGTLVAAAGGYAGLRYYRTQVREVPALVRVERAQEAGEVLDEEEVRARMAKAGAVARQFVETGSLEERMRLVRNAEEVRGRVADYSMEARETVGEVDREMGFSVVEGQGRAGFVITLPSERFRLLELVAEPGGWKVDWDSYARYCSESWESLRTGKAARAEVRVFVSPGSYYNPPFGDQAEWTCFQLTSPDLPHRVFAYSKTDSVQEERLKALVLGAPQYRQHMTLEIAGREGLKMERLFEIVRVRAVGWIAGDEDVETEWGSSAGQ